MILGMVLGLLTRMLLTLLGGSRLEGFLLVWVVGAGFNPDTLCGFFISFIGFRAFSIPADIFLLVNSRRDPIIHNIKQWSVSSGLGHILVKQTAVVQATVGNGFLLVGALCQAMFDAGDGMFTLWMSPFAIVGLQVAYTWTKALELGTKWGISYVLGVIVYSIVGWAFMGSADGYGMLIALNILFFNIKDIWVKGKIANQLTAASFGKKSLPWGAYGISPGGVVVGFITGLFIGCPVSLGGELLLDQSSDGPNRISVQITAGAVNDMTGLLLWLYFGYSRSSYADSLGKAALEIDSSSVFAFAACIFLLSIMSLIMIEWWSYLYLTSMRIWGKLVNALVFIGTLALCAALTSPISLVMGLALIGLVAILRTRYKFPEESKMGMLGVIPLISINWFSLF